MLALGTEADVGLIVGKVAIRDNSCLAWFRALQISSESLRKIYIASKI